MTRISTAVSRAVTSFPAVSAFDARAAVASLRRAATAGTIDEASFRKFVKPYGELLSRPGTFRDTVQGMLAGTGDEAVTFSPAVRTQLNALLRPPSQDAALQAFKKAIANGKLSGADVKAALEPYALVLRQPGRYRDAVSALIQGRTDQSVALSAQASRFFRNEGILRH